MCLQLIKQAVRKKNKMTAETGGQILSVVERAIIDSKEYETQDEVWDYLKDKMSRTEFDKTINQLVLSGKIMFNGPSIIYTGIDNANLKELADSSTP